MWLSIAYHRSPRLLQIGTRLRHKGENYSVSSAVEVLLEAQRPEHCIPRNESVFARESLGVGHHGLTYTNGFDHRILLIGKTDRRDSYWLGELQKRHHHNPAISQLADRSLQSASDKELAKNYWCGEPSKSENWERVARSAYVLCPLRGSI